MPRLSLCNLHIGDDWDAKGSHDRASESDKFIFAGSMKVLWPTISQHVPAIAKLNIRCEFEADYLRRFSDRIRYGFRQLTP